MDLQRTVEHIHEEVSTNSILLAELKATLKSVHEQTLKTNGRVTTHDTRLDETDKRISYATGAVAVGLLIVMPLLVYIFNIYIGSDQIQRAVDYAIDKKLSAYDIEVK